MHDGIDRARGLMAGIAAGNLLGIVQEGWPRRRVAARYPDGVREIAALPGYPDDDDLAQAIVIAEAAEAGPLDPDDLGRRLWHWAETNGAGMGGLTGDALERYGGSYPQRLARNRREGRARQPAGMAVREASRAAWKGSRAGNGALMRCAPVAVRWRDDAVALVRNSVVSAVPTHWDPRCGWSCVLANLAAAAALRGESVSAGALLEACVDGARASLPELTRYGYEARVPDAVRNAVREASEAVFDTAFVDGVSKGFTLVTLRVALNAYWRAATFEEGLRRVIEAGGDTDTNGAVVGALLGARFGSNAIPPRWRDRVAEIRAGRTPLESYADRLLGVDGG
jgi:ADP-ribosyl-[dinitrogen reductase] hydrolase